MLWYTELCRLQGSCVGYVRYCARQKCAFLIQSGKTVALAILATKGQRGCMRSAGLQFITSFTRWSIPHRCCYAKSAVCYIKYGTISLQKYKYSVIKVYVCSLYAIIIICAKNSRNHTVRYSMALNELNMSTLTLKWSCSLHSLELEHLSLFSLYRLSTKTCCRSSVLSSPVTWSYENEVLGCNPQLYLFPTRGESWDNVSNKIIYNKSACYLPRNDFDLWGTPP